MTTSASWKPAGYQQVIPSLSVPKAKAALELYKAAFGAELLDCMLDKTGELVMHAALRIFDTVVFVSEPFPDMGYPPSVFSAFMYVPDVDAAFKRAVDAGATVKTPPADMFWGGRSHRPPQSQKAPRTALVGTQLMAAVVCAVSDALCCAQIAWRRWWTRTGSCGR